MSPLPAAPARPMIVLGVLIGVSWLILQRSLHPSHLILATILGVALPLLTRRFWPAPTYITPTWMLLRIGRRLLWDIVVANLQVAALILGPRSAWRPAFFEVPLDLKDEFAISVLSSLISLTPGTVSVEVGADLRVIRVHGLRVVDEAATIAQIKERYERPLGEIFAC